MIKRTPLTRKSTLKRSVGLKTAPGRKKRKKIVKSLGVKVWALTKADSIFSENIRLRDRQCLFPGCERTDQLTCSHYFGRAKKSTRFDEDNCITLCRTHHYWDKDIGWEFQKQRKGEKGCDWDGRYTLFMKEWLGNERWEALILRAEESLSQRKAIEAWMEIHQKRNGDKLEAEFEAQYKALLEE